MPIHLNHCGFVSGLTVQLLRSIIERIKRAMLMYEISVLSCQHVNEKKKKEESHNKVFEPSVSLTNAVNTSSVRHIHISKR